MRAQQLEGATVRTVDTIDQAFDLLARGAADAVINDDIPALSAMAERPGVFRIAGEPLSRDPWGLVMPLGDTDLCQKVNAALTTIRANGTYAQLFRKWFKCDPPERE